MSKQKNKKAFTLIELLVVIAIIGLLSTFATIALSNARSKAKDVKVMADLKNIAMSFERYYSDYESYPSTTPHNGVAITKADCANSNELYIIYKDTDNTTKICSNKPLKRGSNTYMSSIPKSPEGADYLFSVENGKAIIVGYLNNTPFGFSCTSGACAGVSIGDNTTIVCSDYTREGEESCTRTGACQWTRTNECISSDISPIDDGLAH